MTEPSLFWMPLGDGSQKTLRRMHASAETNFALSQSRRSVLFCTFQAYIQFIEHTPQSNADFDLLVI